MYRVKGNDPLPSIIAVVIIVAVLALAVAGEFVRLKVNEANCRAAGGTPVTHWASGNQYQENRVECLPGRR